VGHLCVYVSKIKWLEWLHILCLPVCLKTSYGETVAKGTVQNHYISSNFWSFLCWCMSNQCTSFCSIIFGTIVPSASFDLTSFHEYSLMRRTPWHPIAVCAVAAASQYSYFSQCFYVKFYINHFQCLHLKKLICLCYILWRISCKLCDFHTSLILYCLCIGYWLCVLQEYSNCCVLYEVNFVFMVRLLAAGTAWLYKKNCAIDPPTAYIGCYQSMR